MACGLGAFGPCPGRHHSPAPDQKTAKKEARHGHSRGEAVGRLARPPAQRGIQTEAAPGAIITTGAAKFLAVFRVVLGFEFLWAFLDKTFGLGYATPAERAWINGGSPTKGFLRSAPPAAAIRADSVATHGGAA
jgi:hypothetical protein